MFSHFFSSLPTFCPLFVKNQKKCKYEASKALVLKELGVYYDYSMVSRPYGESQT